MLPSRMGLTLAVGIVVKAVWREGEYSTGNAMQRLIREHRKTIDRLARESEISPSKDCRVPHISLVFREMWDSTAVHRPLSTGNRSCRMVLYTTHTKGEVRGIPHLAKYERDVGHPSLVTEQALRSAHGGPARVDHAGYAVGYRRQRRAGMVRPLLIPVSDGVEVV